MGLYLLGGIVFILFIVFIVDLIRDARHNDMGMRPPGRYNQFNQYTSEFGEDEFIDYDDYRYSSLYDNEFAEEDNIDLYNDRRNIQEDNDFQMNFEDFDLGPDTEFGHDVTEDVKEPKEIEDENHRHFD